MSNLLPDAPPDGPHRVHLVDDRWTRIRQAVEVIAIVAAGLWAFYIFVYQERIKPANEPAALDDSISIHRLGRDARRDILSVSVFYRNAGKTELDIAADGYVVYGIRYGTKPRTRRTGDAQEAEVDAGIPEQSRTLVKSFMELRGAAAGGPDRHIIMEPDATETLDYTVVVPRGAYDALFAGTIASPIKTPVHRKMDVKIEHEPDGSLWLTGPHDNFDEDDNITEFALIP